MTLPTITYPTWEVRVPSTGLPVRMRPMLVREEKILLMAKEEASAAAMNRAMIQVLDACIVQGASRPAVAFLPIFDVEYLFLRLRGFSIGNEVSVSYIDTEDQKRYDFRVDLEKVSPPVVEKKVTDVRINDDVSIRLRYPPAAVYGEQAFNESSDADAMAWLIRSSIEAVIETKGEKTHEASMIPIEELDAFIDGLDVTTYGALRSHVAGMPRMEHVLTYTNSLGNERTITLATLEDFFIF